MSEIGALAGTVTFLLTDIEGSTARWERAPDAMRRALARHDALLHEGIAAHGGTVLTERGEGDSFFALFAQAGAALAAACALQRALLAEPWPAEVAPLRVRMALHSGEAGLRAGADYRGAGPNRCARLRAVAHGGQVLLSGATYELARAALPAGVSMRDLGQHRLKDLLRPERIYQLAHPALPEAFPPLATLDERLRRLPVQLTPLVGREREVAAVRSFLLDRGVRLLTLTGPGGVGKTRLALQAAAEAIEAFPDGAYFVNLAPISDPTLVLPTIAQALGVAEPGGKSLTAALRVRLRDARTLLLLDNCEQVIEAAPELAELLGAGPGVAALATSRAALRVRGERTYAVPPLTLPDAGVGAGSGGGTGAEEAAGAALDALGGVPLETLTQSEAVRLFAARAREAQPSFALTHRTAPAVAAICARLDGLPLAIELAAARSRLLPPGALLRRLENRLGLLTGGARDLPARQQTLRATIDWSYDLLIPDERRLFAQLGVFAGGCTLEAAEAVCGGAGTADRDGVDIDVLAGVEALAAQSLLRLQESGVGNSDGPAGSTNGAGGEGHGDEPRLMLLETVREYALERLEASDEVGTLRAAHAAFYLALAAEAAEFIEVQTNVWLPRLNAERDNLRAALRWAREHDSGEAGLRAATALWQVCALHGYVREGRAWLDSLLARHPGGQGVSPLAWARACNAAGTLARLEDDYGAAEAWGRRSLAAFEELDDTGGVAGLLNNLALVARFRGDYAQAEALHERSLAHYRALNDGWGITLALTHLGTVARGRGDLARAAALLDESMALSRAAGNPLGVAHAAVNAGLVACDQGDFARAQELTDEGLRLLRQLGDQYEIAWALYVLGCVAAAQGDGLWAAALLNESLRMYVRRGTRRDLVACLEAMARVLYMGGQAEGAVRLLAATAAARQILGVGQAPVDRAAAEKVVIAARATLGEEAFIAAWDAGAALMLDQAIVEALGAYDYAAATPVDTQPGDAR